MEFRSPVRGALHPEASEDPLYTKNFRHLFLINDFKITTLLLKQLSPVEGQVLVVPTIHGSPEGWSGCVFVRQGPYSNAVLRFVLRFPEQYPDHAFPTLEFVDETVVHPLVFPRNAGPNGGCFECRHIVRRMFESPDEKHKCVPYWMLRYVLQAFNSVDRIERCVKDFPRDIPFPNPGTRDLFFQDRHEFVKLAHASASQCRRVALEFGIGGTQPRQVLGRPNVSVLWKRIREYFPQRVDSNVPFIDWVSREFGDIISASVPR
eukprot:ANDGO_05420.mRNA.1 Protein crossbronx homolog